jgi:hypothetical protein
MAVPSSPVIARSRPRADAAVVTALLVGALMCLAGCSGAKANHERVHPRPLRNRLGNHPVSAWRLYRR